MATKLKVLLDLDNTLMDWGGKVVKHVDEVETLAEFNQLPNSKDILQSFYVEDPHWWADISPMEDGIALVRWLIENDVAFGYLTAIGHEVVRPDIAIRDKVAFIEKHIDQRFGVDTKDSVHFVNSSKQKCLYSKPEHYVLVDDYYRSCTEWIDAGGLAVHFEGAGRLTHAMLRLGMMMSDGLLLKTPTPTFETLLEDQSTKRLLNIVNQELLKIRDGLNVCCAVVNTCRDENRRGLKVTGMCLKEIRRRLVK